MNEKYEKARLVAIKAHGEQKYGEQPYEYHLQKVVDVLTGFGFTLDSAVDADLLISAWLHDSLEDTSLTKADIENEFGEEVAETVWRVTDEEGQNRKERKEKTYLKTRESEKAIILKLADRIANVESCLKTNKGLLKMYQKEQPTFAEKLKPYFQTEKTSEMWRHLEGLLK